VNFVRIFAVISLFLKEEYFLWTEMSLSAPANAEYRPHRLSKSLILYTDTRSTAFQVQDKDPISIYSDTGTDGSDERIEEAKRS
jgi:hypothetical protein